MRSPFPCLHYACDENLIVYLKNFFLHRRATHHSYARWRNTKIVRKQFYHRAIGLSLTRRRGGAHHKKISLLFDRIFFALRFYTNHNIVHITLCARWREQSYEIEIYF